METQKYTTQELLQIKKEESIAQLNLREKNHILDEGTKDLLIQLIRKADSIAEVDNIYGLGVSRKNAGFVFKHCPEHFDCDTIKYLARNEALSFRPSRENGLTHKLIIGDNYPALTNLLLTHYRSVDVIYIDPPYGKDSLGHSADTNYGNGYTRETLLSLMYPRLKLARDLLKDDGVIFCSIDDKNQAYVKGLFDDVFGEENFVGTLPVIRNLKGKNDTYGFSNTHEYLLVYTKKERGAIFGGTTLSKEEIETYNMSDGYGRYKKGAALKRTGADAPREKRPNCYYPIFISEE